MIYDGDCQFCRLWIERWREITAARSTTSHSRSRRAISGSSARASFEHAVQLIETDGRVFSGAEAVYRSLGQGDADRWLTWCYDHVPGFAAISETGLLHSSRDIASWRFGGYRLLWGNDVRRPTYFHARRWFLRSLGVIYLIAFVSLWVQVDGLIGANGISAGPRISAGRAASNLGARCLLHPADALLAQFEQRVPAFSLRRRRVHFSCC